MFKQLVIKKFLIIKVPTPYYVNYTDLQKKLISGKRWKIESAVFYCTFGVLQILHYSVSINELNWILSLLCHKFIQLTIDNHYNLLYPKVFGIQIIIKLKLP